MAKKINFSKEQYELIIPADSVCKGCITTSSNIRIDGIIKGDISSENGNILLRTGSSVVGNVSGRDIAAGGRIQGDVQAREQMSIFAGAHMIGNITTQALVMEQGSLFEGYVKVESTAKQTGTKQDASKNTEPERKQAIPARPEAATTNTISVGDMFFKNKTEDTRKN